MLNVEIPRCVWSLQTEVRRRVLVCENFNLDVTESSDQKVKFVALAVPIFKLQIRGFKTIDFNSRFYHS